LVIALSRRLPDGRYEIDVPLVISVPAQATKQWIRVAMERASKELETWIQQYPEQWLWLHRRWKE